MKKFTAKAAVFLILAVIGAAVAAYSIKTRNYILLAAAIFSPGNRPGPRKYASMI